MPRNGTTEPAVPDDTFKKYAGTSSNCFAGDGEAGRLPKVGCTTKDGRRAEASASHFGLLCVAYGAAAGRIKGCGACRGSWGESGLQQLVSSFARSLRI